MVGCALGDLGRGLRRPAPDPWRASGWASRSKRQKHRLSLSSPEPSNVSAKRFAPCPDAEAVCVRQRRRPPQACRHTTTPQRPRLEKGRAAHSPARARFQRLDVCLAPSEGDFVVRLPIHGERPAGRVARSDKSIASLYPLPNPATSAQNALLLVPTQRPFAFDRDVDRLKRADTQPLRNDRGSKRVALPTALQEFAFSGWMCAWLPRKGTSSSGSRSMESVRLGESLEATKASPPSILSRTQQRQRRTLCSLSRRRGRLRSTETSTASSVQTHNHSATTAARKGSRCPQRCKSSLSVVGCVLGSLGRGLRRPAPDPWRASGWASRSKRQKHRLSLSSPEPSNVSAKRFAPCPNAEAVCVRQRRRPPQACRYTTTLQRPRLGKGSRCPQPCKSSLSVVGCVLGSLGRGTSSSGSRSMESVRLGESLEATKASPLSILSRTQQRQRKTLCSLSRRRGRLRSTETSTASSVQTHNHSATTSARKGSRCPQRMQEFVLQRLDVHWLPQKGTSSSSS